MRIHVFTAPFLFSIAHALSCDLLSFTFGLALIRVGFFVHFILPHARGDHFALGAASVAHGLRHGLYGGERACEAAADDVCGIHDEEKGMRVDFFDVPLSDAELYSAMTLRAAGAIFAGTAAGFARK